MLVVETIAKVRRDHFVHGKSIKQISRERGLSRNSVRKILRSEETVSSRKLSTWNSRTGLPSTPLLNIWI